MKDLVSSVSIGKLDKQLVVDVNKDEEDWEEGEGATDMPFAFLSTQDKLTLMQLDGNITPKQYKEAMELARKAIKQVYEVQKKALKESINEEQ